MDEVRWPASTPEPADHAGEEEAPTRGARLFEAPAGAVPVRRLSLLRERAADRLPVAWRSRWAVAPGAALAAVVIAIAAVLGAGARIWWVRARADPVVVQPVVAASGAAASSAAAPTAAPASVPGGVPAGLVTGGAPAAAAGVVVVDVVGQVRHPGLVRLPAGSRVADAIAAAGGATRAADIVRVNLARVLVDGEQLVLPRPGETLAAQPAPAGPGTSGAPAAPVDLNAASESDLDALPGVGPVLAGRILAWRAQHGRFSRVEELGEVSGIGDKLLAELTPLVRV
jgi:competence protein ComEA